MHNQEKEDQLLKKRIEELAARARYQKHYTFTSFLSLAEQEIVWQHTSSIGYPYVEMFGGSDECERKTARFGDLGEIDQESNYPISCIRICPCLEKFADEFSHRDFLGALMNLGIERAVLGDIFIESKTAYVYCLDSIAEYICEHLEQVKHTKVKAKISDTLQNHTAHTLKEVKYQVSAERIDSIVAKFCKASRSDAVSYFQNKLVYVNGRLYEKTSGKLKEGDTVSVRGFGKFIYLGVENETKKGKINIKVSVYCQ